MSPNDTQPLLCCSPPSPVRADGPQLNSVSPAPRRRPPPRSLTHARTHSLSPLQVGVSAATLSTPLAQSLRYAVSGVVVHLLFIGLVVARLAISTPRGSPLHVQVPLSLLALDALTLINATGLIDPNTAGHPRCATSTIGECASALSTFLPVMLLDAAASGLAIAGVYPKSQKPKQT